MYAFKHNPHMHAIYHSLLDIIEYAIYVACIILHCGNNMQRPFVQDTTCWDGRCLQILQLRARHDDAATQHRCSQDVLTWQSRCPCSLIRHCFQHTQRHSCVRPPLFSVFNSTIYNPHFPLVLDLRSTHNPCKSRRYTSWYLSSIQNLNLINLLSSLIILHSSVNF